MRCFGHVNLAQGAVPHLFKFGKRVQSLVTLNGVLYTHTDNILPVCSQLIIFKNLEF